VRRYRSIALAHLRHSVIAAGEREQEAVAGRLHDGCDLLAFEPGGDVGVIDDV
jgi:hypothetical protein